MRTISSILAVSLTANLLFLVFSLAAASLPREPIARRVARAFASGELLETDNLPTDVRRGFHQYDDCIILQMMTNADDAWARALGPLLFVTDLSYSDICRTLRQIVVERRDTAPMHIERYSRYWQGALSAATWFLSRFELATTRKLLQALTFGSVLLVMAAGLRERQLLPFTAPVAAFGLSFWGLPLFGQGLTHAFGDAAVMIGLAGLLAGRRRFFDRPDRQLVYCAAWGAVVTFFDMLTGGIPTAAGFLLPAVYLSHRAGGGTPRRAIQLAILAALAFAFASVITVTTRVALAALLLRPSGVNVFFDNLALYTSATGAGALSYAEPLMQLFRRGVVLTFWNRQGWTVLVLASAAAWLAAIVIARRRRGSVPFTDVAALALGAMAIPAWSLLLPTHTYMHADFMARMLIVPLALGFAALGWAVVGGWTRGVEAGG